MEVKIKRRFHQEVIETDLADFTAGHTSGGDYDRGALETVEAATDNVVQFLGKLVDLLAAKKVLTNEDLTKLFGDEVELIF